MIISVKFDGYIGLVQGVSYFFYDIDLFENKSTRENSSDLDCYKLNYLGDSRNTGESIFKVLIKGDKDFLHYKCYRDNCRPNIISYHEIYLNEDDLNDYDLRPSHSIIKSNNEKMLVKKLLEIVNIDEDILYNEESYLNVIRDIKIKMLYA